MTQRPTLRERSVSLGRFARDALDRHGNVICRAVLLAIPFVIVVLSGNISAGPRLVDDNQIFMLDRQIAEEGLAATAAEHLHQRLFVVERLVPVYLVHKLFQIELLGTNLVAWGLYNALLGGITACLLFAFGRLVRLSVVEAFAFALIVLLGEQSVLWWRHLHGEGIGMLFVALSMLCIPLSTRYPARATAFRALFVVFAILAAFTKESFLVLLPALVFGLMMETRRAHGSTWVESLRRNAVPAVVLGTVCAAAIALIATRMERTHFEYTGWKGFDAENFGAIAAEFFGGDRFWFVALAIGVGLVCLRGIRNDRALLGPFVQHAGALAVLVGLILVPQFLLYMSSGFSGSDSAHYSRFLVPATLGLAVLTVFPVAWVRQRLEATNEGPRDSSPVFFRRTAAVVLAVALLPRYETALAEADAFYAQTADINSFLNAVNLYTDEDDTVVFILGISSVQGYTRRMTIMLAEYAGLELENMYFLPVLGRAPPGSFAYRFPITRDPYVTRMVEGLVESRAELPSVDTVVIATDRRTDTEKLFLLESYDWFDPADYLRLANRRGDVAYFKPEALPDHLATYSEYLTEATARVERMDGVVRVSGGAQSPRHVDRILIRAGERVVEPEMSIERRPVFYPYHRAYSGEWLSFELEAPWPDDAPLPESIALYSGDSLLAEVELEHADAP